MSFATTYYALVNTSDGTITGHGKTSADQPLVPQGATIVSVDQYATIDVTVADGQQCRLIGGVVRLMPAVVPALVDLDAIKAAAYVQIDTAAEAIRGAYITPGSGQALEYQQTSADAERLLAIYAPAPVAVTGTVEAQTTPPRAGTEEPGQPASAPASAAPTPSAEPNPADYPWLAAEQRALAAIGVFKTLLQIAQAVHDLMQAWSTVGSIIKEIRRQAKLQVSIATTAAAITAILDAITWPPAPTTTGPG